MTDGRDCHADSASIWKTMTVLEVSLTTVREFVETWHYSRSVNGVKVDVCFAMMSPDVMLGAAIFGPLATTAWKAYNDNEQRVTELRRFVCVDDCPRNTETWFLARCLRIMRRKGAWDVVVSYADPEFGHCGLIYQAGNWSYRGQTNDDTVLIEPSGKRHHSRSLRTRYNGHYKPFVRRLREMAARGELEVRPVPGKHIYTYNLNGSHHCNGLPYPKAAAAHNDPDIVRIIAEQAQTRLL